MKKIICLSLCLLFVLTLTACGGRRDDSTSMQNTTSDNMGSSVVSDIGSGIQSGMSSVGSAIASAADGITDNVVSADAKISSDEAKAAALKHANFKETDVSGLTVKLEKDDGVLKYEVDFSAGGTEYDYEINANTGEIISSDTDKD